MKILKMNNDPKKTEEILQLIDSEEVQITGITSNLETEQIKQ